MKFNEQPQPIMVVNGYLWDSLKAFEDFGTMYNYGSIVPIFPLSDATSANTKWENKPYLIYNKAFRVSHNTDYRIKKETFIYNLKANDLDTFYWSTAIQSVLDRQDDAAWDVNEWNREHLQAPVSFHSIRVYQNEPPDARDFSVKPFYTTQFNVVVEYHLTV